MICVKAETNATMMEECFLAFTLDQPLDWWPCLFTFGVWNLGPAVAHEVVVPSAGPELELLSAMKRLHGTPRDGANVGPDSF